MSETTLLLFDTTRLICLLEGLLYCERTAADTYRLALDRLGSDAPVALCDSLESHVRRSALLAEHIQGLGGLAVNQSGIWSGFTRLFANGRTRIDRHAICTALQEGEYRIMVRYHDAAAQLDDDTLALFEEHLLPELYRIHHAMSNLANKGG